MDKNKYGQVGDKLWSDTHSEDDVMEYSGETLIRDAIFNLYEDIKVLKEHVEYHESLTSAIKQEDEELRNIIELIAKSLDIDEPRYKWISIEIDDLKSKLQAAESKLEEINKAEPVSYEQMIDHEWVKISKARFTQLDGVSWIQKRELYLHPQVQSNADKEIDKPCRVGHMIFREGVKVKTVIEAAQRQYENNPSKEIPADAVCFRNPRPVNDE